MSSIVFSPFIVCWPLLPPSYRCCVCVCSEPAGPGSRSAGDASRQETVRGSDGPAVSAPQLQTPPHQPAPEQVSAGTRATSLRCLVGSGRLAAVQGRVWSCQAVSNRVEPCRAVRRPAGRQTTQDTWADKIESFERINSIREAKGNFDSCNYTAGSQPFKWVTWVKISICFTYRIYPFEYKFEFFCSCIRGQTTGASDVRQIRTASRALSILGCYLADSVAWGVPRS